MRLLILISILLTGCKPSTEPTNIERTIARKDYREALANLVVQTENKSYSGIELSAELVKTKLIAHSNHLFDVRFDVQALLLSVSEFRVFWNYKELESQYLPASGFMTNLMVKLNPDAADLIYATSLLPEEAGFQRRRTDQTFSANWYLKKSLETVRDQSLGIISKLQTD